MISFTIPGEPMPKPRQTQRDKWMKRPCVMEYRAWADVARMYARQGGYLKVDLPLQVTAIFYLPIPLSYSAKKRAMLAGQPHRLKGDADNFGKALLDALWPGLDAAISDVTFRKRWDDGKGTRVLVELHEGG